MNEQQVQLIWEAVQDLRSWDEAIDAARSEARRTGKRQCAVIILSDNEANIDFTEWDWGRDCDGVYMFCPVPVNGHGREMSPSVYFNPQTWGFTRAMLDIF